jgi:hypothetical protein
LATRLFYCAHAIGAQVASCLSSGRIRVNHFLLR